MRETDLARTLRLRLRSAVPWLRALRRPPDALFSAALLSALAAFLLLGVIVRAGAAVPRSPTTAVLFDVILAVGVIVRNAALLFAVFFLALSAWCRRRSDRWTAVILVVVLSLAALAVLAGSVAALSAAYTAALAALGIALVARILRVETPVTVSPSRRYATHALHGSLVIVYLLVAAAYGASAIRAEGVPFLLGLAEITAIVVAVISPFSLAHAMRPVPLLVASGAAALLGFAALRSPLVPLIAIWSVSFTMSFPLPLYVLGIGCAAYTLAERLPAERLSGRAAGLLLLMITGIGLRDTYELLLVATGLLWFLDAPWSAALSMSETKP